MKNLLSSWFKQLLSNWRLVVIVLFFSISLISGGIYFFSYLKQQKFKDFRTNLSKTNINLDDLVVGKVAKNDIPNLSHPKLKFQQAKDLDLKPFSEGVLVDVLGRKRFYPLNILTWHEVVNEFFDGVPYVITYSPLCDSAVVFQSSINDEGLTFRASGFLYQNNLVFYDTKTESLWSQAANKAIAGEMVGTKIKVLPNTQIMTFAEVKKNFPETEVLSEDTGYILNYSFNPYSGYNLSKDIFYPVNVVNKRFPQKEMMYVVPLENKSLAFSAKNFPEGKIRERVVDGVTIRAGRIGKEIIVNKDKERLSGYQQMWFCWYAQHQDDGIVWEYDKSLDNLKTDAIQKEATNQSVVPTEK